ncbi:MAG TPA: ferredoxin-type protein NapG, partial [Albitalea sp.]
KVLPVDVARGAPGAHYRKGWEPDPAGGRPRFDTPVPRLPAEPAPGELVPLRSGAAPYPSASGAAK